MRPSLVVVTASVKEVRARSRQVEEVELELDEVAGSVAAAEMAFNLTSCSGGKEPLILNKQNYTHLIGECRLNIKAFKDVHDDLF